MSATLTPTAAETTSLHTRLGPLHERLAPLASAWRSVNGYEVCTRVRHEASGDGPWLTCATHGARIGFKGRGSSEWLAAQGLSLPTAPNRWLRDASGMLVARLGAQDFLLFDDLEVETTLPGQLATRWQSSTARGGIMVPRQHGLACIAIGGAAAPALLARLCAVELEPPVFGDDALAQTQLALTSVVILRVASAGGASYRVMVDTSLALYLWDVLHEVADALGGGVLGSGQFSALHRS